jgi:formylglycine-generating enzyme required for sulfatase activity
VGEKEPNNLGLYDTLGNVWEWTESEWGSSRVLRGGGWDYDPGTARVAFRNGFEPGFRYDILGFRLARG